ncbi:MAG TPA: hypothetical protein PLH36_14245, partial [Armatimonadota bacterium]|nr:hypothetical protein [Armatimonadota bacterium]
QCQMEIQDHLHDKLRLVGAAQCQMEIQDHLHDKLRLVGASEAPEALPVLFPDAVEGLEVLHQKAVRHRPVAALNACQEREVDRVAVFLQLLGHLAKRDPHGSP